MSDNPDALAPIEYVETLVMKALKFNGKTKSARRARFALLRAALVELQAERAAKAGGGVPRSE
jgi:hypothetical protein